MKSFFHAQGPRLGLLVDVGFTSSYDEVSATCVTAYTDLRVMMIRPGGLKKLWEY